MKLDLFLVIAQIGIILCYALDPGWYSWDLPLWLRYLALIDLVLGILILLAGLFTLGDNLTPLPRPKTNGELVTHGVYRFIRHPLYAGILFGMAGGSIYLASGWKLFFTLLIWLLFYLKTEREENYLTDRFPDYEEYKRNTGRFLPKIG
ncbi:methyltransferase family protein [Aureitalea marina]|uniref:Protein-S-isoprenylcysteine methyltransferase n=1 Tax=Aureitalea marina TaxID=930804 RepID=A0A2S7KPW1_9FLAO|nr:isoprenylcysteine carboxylmethyltransferase family protein [Aureitalea marina]PQB04664.1 hypothetical protein BST85_06965 [Aureitalea marina]